MRAVAPEARALIAARLHRLERHQPGALRHACRVAHASAGAARRLGLPPGEVQAAALAGLLHDAGKVAVPAAILGKAARLEGSERLALRAHVWAGLLLAARLPGCVPDVLAGVLLHHERWDGSGYPLGVRAECIPLAARIVAAADVGCALREERAYRPAWAPAEAWRYLRERAGVLFDPQVVLALAQEVLDAP